MPAYNESGCITKSIREVEERFEPFCKDLEIIVVDDGSTDGTAEIVENLGAESVKVVSYQQNQGKGRALQLGFHRVTGEYTFFVDSDQEIHPKELWDYVSACEKGDVVIGSKRHPLSVVRTPTFRKVLSLGFNVLERILTGVRASDTQAGLKAGKSSALYRILPLLSVKRYAFDAELLTVATLLGLRIEELPVEVDLRATFSVRQVFRMMIDLLGIAYRLRVKRWYQENSVKMSETYKPIISW